MKQLEEAHDTEDGYCCACGYDIAVMENRISQQRQSIIEEIEKLPKMFVENSRHYYGEDFARGMGEPKFLVSRDAVLALLDKLGGKDEKQNK